MRTIRFWGLLFGVVFAMVVPYAQPTAIVTSDALKSRLKSALLEHDLIALGKGYEQLGQLYSQNPRSLSEGLNAYLTSYDYFRAMRDSAAMFVVGEQLTRVWMRQRRFDLAQNQLDLAIGYYNRKNNKPALAHTLALLAQVSVARGDTLSTSRYQREALQSIRELADTALLAELVLDLSVVQLRRNNIDSASLLVYEGLKMSEQIENKALIQRSMQTLGRVMMAKQNYPDAVYYLQQSLKYSTAKGDNLFQLRDTYRDLAESLAKVDNTTEAYRYMQAYAALNDSLQDIGQLELISRFSEEFSLKTKDQTIAALNQENSSIVSRVNRQRLLNYSLTFLFFALLGVLFLGYKFYQQRMRYNQQILVQQAAINQSQRTEFENKGRIESMRSMVVGQESERARIARELHDSLGGLLSSAKMQLNAVAMHKAAFAKNKNFDAAYKMVIEACAEVRVIAHQMQPVALSKLGLAAAINDLLSKVPSAGAPKITFQHFGLEDPLEKTVALHAYRIVQELLQNALKHAKATELLIELNHYEKTLSITVEDNGIGFNSSLDSAGMGLDNISARSSFLGGEVSIDTAPKKGCTVLVVLPTQAPTKLLDA